MMQVLRQVYVDHTNIDDELVRSIALPANDPNAAKIFYRVITGWGGAGTPVNELLSKLQVLGLRAFVGRAAASCWQQLLACWDLQSGSICNVVFWLSCRWMLLRIAVVLQVCGQCCLPADAATDTLLGIASMPAKPTCLASGRPLASGSCCSIAACRGSHCNGDTTVHKLLQLETSHLESGCSNPCCCCGA